MRKGLTIVELLVIMAIISILAMILMPAISSARKLDKEVEEVQTTVQDENRLFRIVRFFPHGARNIPAADALINKYLEEGWKITYATSTDNMVVVFLQREKDKND